MTEATADLSQPTPQLIDVVAAIHHPVRRRLLELLNLGGPNTVSGLADAAQERVGNASHHLRVLAEAGLVVAAPELARDRRERWWRPVEGSISWSVADVAGDPLAEVVASAAEQQNLAHHIGKVQQWYGHREMHDVDWVRAAFSTDYWVSVTPEELAELGRRVNDLFAEYAAGPERQAEPGRHYAFVFAHGVPAKP
jgi:DNA-binding transcriptional ArsR family regulator